MRILITGGDGEFCKHLVKEGKDFSFLTPSKKEADVRNYWQLDRYFYTHQSEFDIVITRSAITKTYGYTRGQSKIKYRDKHSRNF